MRLPPFLRKFPLSCQALLLWVLFCVVWAIVARKPWDTLAFDAELSSKRTPMQDFRAAGLWIGLVLSGLMGVLLLTLKRWWAGPEAGPVIPALPADTNLRTRWFFLILITLIAWAAWLRWPAMTLSFWGDEGMMFCDFVHGKWQPALRGGSVQGDLKFNPVTWDRAFFSDYSGANHWLSSHLQRVALKTWQSLTHQPVWAFEEWVVRLVPLTAGLASLAALAGWLRWMGRPGAGLLAAAVLAVHPSHVRFSVEARGYSLMLLFFILTLWAVTRALRYGRKRDWCWVGLAQFLVMYSWKCGLYALVFVNLVVAVRLLWGRIPIGSARPVAVVRWMASGLIGAMLFLPLAVSSHLQISKSIWEVRGRAKPMEAEWRRNLISETLVGIPWHDEEAANPRDVSLTRQMQQTPWTKAALLILALILLCGMVRLWRQDRFLAWLCLGVLGSGVAAAAHFKYSLRVELLTWYLLYNLPVLALIFSVALTPRPGASKDGWRRWPARRRSIGWGLASTGGLLALTTVSAPMVRDFRKFPRENYKQAWMLTRGNHEPRGYAGPSNVYTAWLWRHTDAYDPREDMYVRTAGALDSKMALARSSGGEFYMIVGLRRFSEVICADVIKALRDPAKFEHLTTFWGVEALNTLDVYKMRKE